MNFSKFQTELRPLLVFNSRDIRKIQPDFNTVNLNNWQNNGYIVKIAKGVYTFGEITIDKNLLFFAANKLIDPSYVSCESALGYYGLINDEYLLVSVNPIKTHEYKSNFGNFKFHKTKALLMKDYILVNVYQHCFKIATPEKALFDFFYFNPGHSTRKQISDLPFNSKAILEKVDEDKLTSLSIKSNNELLQRRIRNFINIFMNRDDKI